MSMKKSGLTVLVCLTVVCLGLSLINCGSGGGGSKKYKGGIYKIEITETLPGAFGGHEFGDGGSVGTYDKYVGRAYGVLDPNDPRNQVIADLALAEKNADGLIEYSTRFFILTPTDPTKGSKVLFDIPNRGNLTSMEVNQFPTTNVNTNFGNTASDAAAVDSSTVPRTPVTYPGFIFNTLGHSLLSVAWDMEPGTEGGTQLRAELPIAYNPDGSSITGPMYEWLTGTTECLTTYYEPANTDPGYATLTQRNHLTDTPEIISTSDWRWGSGNEICLNSGNFTANWIYELVYTAKDPYVAAVGFAATRDAVEFFRYATADSEGNPNPVAGRFKQIVVFTRSQPGRGMNDYVHWGFNEDSKRRKVFDGTMNYIGGGDGMGINYRFAQVGRTERARQNHIAQLEGVFPLSYTTTTDPFTGKRDGRNVRCTASNTCPKVMNIYSANEMWVKAASLATTDPGTGLDVVEPANVRNYQVAGMQHGGSNMPNNVTATATNQFANTTVDPFPVYRALWVAMDKWISEGTLPPASRTSSINQGTAAFVPTDNPAFNVLGIGMVPMADLDFPTMPDDLFNVPSKSIVVTVRPHWNFGPRYDQGILDIIPGIPMGFYKVSVAKVDDTGNEIGALRLPEVEAPIGSNLGWTLRAIGQGGKLEGTDGSDGNGGFIPLAPFAADAATLGDGRKSLEELYGTGAPGEGLAEFKAVWLAKRIAAAQALYDQGFLLEKDRDNYATSGAITLTIGTNAKYPSMYNYTW